MGTLTGIHVGRYQILDLLRFDPAFAVYNATNTQTEEAVHLWILFPETPPGENISRAILERLQFLSLLEHPNLAPIRDFGRENGLIFCVMPACRGVWLADLLTGRRSEKESAMLAGQIAEGLEYLHQQGMIHGCLSPATVFVGEDLTVMICLYGLADLLNREIDRQVPEGMVGFGLGQSGYISPEQIARRDATLESDLYALGAITYALLNGKEPFSATTPAETTFKQMVAPLSWPEHQPVKVSQAAVRFVHKCLARHPEDRFNNASETRRVLDRLAQGKGARVRVSRAQMAGAPKPAYLLYLRLALLAAILVLAGGLAIWRFGGPLMQVVAPAAIARTQPQSPTLSSVQPVETSTPVSTSQPEQATLTPAPAAEQPTNTPVPDEPSPTPADPGAQPTAADVLPGPVLIGTRTPGEAQVIIPANVGQIRESARLGFGKFNQVTWSPDSQKLAVASSAGVFVLGSNSLIAFIDPQDEATSVQFSLDGSILAVGLMKGDIQLWNWQTKEKTQTLQGHKGRISRLIFSPNHRQLISASYDHFIRVWDVNSGSLVRAISAHPMPVKDISLADDGRQLASGSSDHKVFIWDIATGEKTHEFDYQDVVQAVAISGDGLYVAAGGPKGEIYQWSLLKRIYRSNPIPMQHAIWSLYYQDTDTLAVGLEGGQFTTTSAAYNASMGEHNFTSTQITEELLKSFGGAFEYFASAAVSKSGEAATVNWDGTLRLGTSRVTTIPTAFEDFTHLVFSPDSRYLLAGGKLNQVFLWNTADNQLVGQLNNMQIMGGDPFSESSEKIALAAREVISSQVPGDPGEKALKGVIYLSQGLQQDRSLGYLMPVSFMQFTHQDTLLIDQQPYETRLWDYQTKMKALVSPANENGCPVARSSNNREVFSIYTSVGLMREWDDRTRLLCNLSNGFASPTYFSPDRKWLASINANGLLEMRDISANKVIWQKPVDHPINTMVMSPDDTLLVSGSPDGTLTFWDVTSGQIIRTIQAHFDAIRVVAFSPNGKQVASGSGDGTVRIWEVTQVVNP
jgi:WD40 repeat protein/serine/threonine protein kinase